MVSSKGILIKNIYYMLTYAFRVLNEPIYVEIAAEEFEHTHNLFAAILAKGITKQVKQGLHREYISKADNLSLMRGKLDFNGTIQNQLQRKRLLACEYDELSENNVFNQILKTTAFMLLQSKDVAVEYKVALKRNILFFADVDLVDPTTINWSTLSYQRNNQNYKMLMNICYFVLEDLLLTTEKGNYGVDTFLNGQHLPSLYERFILEYYRKHHPYLKPGSKQLNWVVDDGVIEFLPVMKTDVTLSYQDQILIIDAKYYGETMQTHSLSHKQTVHSNNLYQIFAYVKNAVAKYRCEVAGLLLYAKTQEEFTPDLVFSLTGNKILVKTLDLNLPFGLITKQLDDVVYGYFRLSEAITGCNESNRL